MTISKEQLDNLRSEDGTFSQHDAKALEKMEGKPLKEIIQQVDKQSDIPEGNPAKDWSRPQKLAYLKNYSREEYQQLIDERK